MIPECLEKSDYLIRRRKFGVLAFCRWDSSGRKDSHCHEEWFSGRVCERVSSQEIPPPLVVGSAVRLSAPKENQNTYSFHSFTENPRAKNTFYFPQPFQGLTFLLREAVIPIAASAVPIPEKSNFPRGPAPWNAVSRNGGRSAWGSLLVHSQFCKVLPASVTPLLQSFAREGCVPSCGPKASMCWSLCSGGV